jgi:hypothetical protein
VPARQTFYSLFHIHGHPENTDRQQAKNGYNLYNLNCSDPPTVLQRENVFLIYGKVSKLPLRAKKATFFTLCHIY